MAIEIEMTADVRNIIKALKSGEVSLDDFEDSLDDAGDAGEDAGRTIKRGAEEASDALDETSEASDELGGKLGDIGGIATDVLEGDLAGAAQGALGALSALGAGGAIAGALAAAGVGLISEGLTATQQAADEMARRLSAAYQKAAEDGRTFLDEAQIQAAALDVLFDPTLREQAKSDARAIGVEAIEFVRAMVGDREALNRVIEAGAQAEAEARAQTEGMVGANGEALESYNSRLSIIGNINERLAEQQALADENARAAELAMQLYGQSNEEIQKLNKSMAETPKTLPTTVTLDSSAVDSYVAKNISKSITVEFKDRYGRRID